MTALRHFFGRLLRRPMYAATAVLTLALGVGACVALFAVVYGVLLQPLPYAEPDGLVSVWHTAPGMGLDQVEMSPALYFTYRYEASVFTDLALWSPRISSITGLDEPEEVEVIAATDGLFPLLGVQPALGRLFGPADDLPESPRTVVLGHDYWQSRFGGSREVVGETMRIDGEPWVVIGVLPAGFALWKATGASIYRPLRLDRARAATGLFNYPGVARLAPGATAAQAEAEMNRLVPVAAERFPGGVPLRVLQEAGFHAYVRPLAQDVVGDVGDALWVLFGTAALVLVIACANVANLFLVRAEERHREMAVREALGAGRWGVVRELLSESIGLGLIGGAAGLALAWAALRLLVRMAPPALPRVREIGVEPTVVAFALAASLASGVAFGLVAAIRMRRDGLLLSGLREGGRGGSSGRERNRARSLLTVTQVALALVLLVSSGLLMRSFRALRAVEPGFRDPEEILTFRVFVPQAEQADGRQAVDALRRVVAEIRTLPGVASVTAVSMLPMQNRSLDGALLVEGVPVDDGRLPPSRRYKFIGGNHASTMGQRMVAGRELTWSDITERRPVVMVSESFAREHWQTPEAALGRTVADLAPPGPSWKEIVGVVEDLHDDGAHEPPVKVVYWPLVVGDFWGNESYAQRSVAIVVRSDGKQPLGLVPAVERAVWSVNPDLPLAEVMTLAEVRDRSMARTSFTLTILALCAGMALLLGCVGIYGVLSFLVVQRTREIGVRLALGAQRASVSGMLIRHGMLLTTIGVVVGLAAAAGVTRVLESLLFGVGAIDPPTYIGVSVGLATVALVASGIASLRAARVDPIEALRSE
jgi:predicted permease